MAGRKKTILDEVEVIESAVAAELTRSNNLNKPDTTEKAEKVDITVEAEKVEKVKKAVKTAETAEAEKAVKTKKTAETEKAVKTKKTAETEKAVKTGKTAKTEKAEKTTRTTKTTKAANSAKTETATKTKKTTKAVKEETLPEIIVPDQEVRTEIIEKIEPIPVVDDISEYIQPNSLEALKARYAAVEEDEQIRNEGFELATKSGLIKRPRPEETSFEYHSAPASKDDIRTDVDSSLSAVFDSTKSEFDADTVSFEDITTNKKNELIITPPVSPETIRATGNRYGYDTHTTVIYVDESADDGIRRNSETELTSAFTEDIDKQKRRKFPWSRKRK